MKILITGSAGFIGFSLSEYLLKNNNFEIFGIDNLNNYYDVNLKTARLKILKNYKKFYFKKIDINNNYEVEKLFKKYKFDFVFNLAAQAGVRYSIEFPRKYLDTNINGFFNIIENSTKYKVKRLFYASSSSVYGENKNFPLKENEKITPKNMYALTKKINEEISTIYNNYYKLKVTGLRFFTVYGEWGRPDMMILKYIGAFYKKEEFQLFNFGNHERDFTYIGDVVKILDILIKKHNKLKNHEIFNICSNKPINLKKIISYMGKKGIKPKTKKVSLQRADILKTHGNNNKILKLTKYKKFLNWEKGVDKTVNWYRNFIIN